MTAAAQHHHNQPPSSSKPPRNSANPTSGAAPPQTPNPNNPTSSSSAAAAEASPIALHDRNHPFSHAAHLTRHELLKRRSHLLKQLSRCYRDHYWALMEELKAQYREYYWKYGVSPFKDEQQQQHQLGLDDGGEGEREREGGNFSSVEAMDESNHGGGNLPMMAAACGGNNSNGNLSSKGEIEVKNWQSSRCKSPGCRLKAMALTAYCHLHILCDSKQKLYKACTFVIKSAQAGPITCGKPILRSTVPALCPVHFQKAQQHVTRALKKAGLNVSSSSKLAPKFHVIVAEYVRQIQSKRRATKKANLIKDVLAAKEVKTEGGNCSAVKP